MIQHLVDTCHMTTKQYDSSEYLISTTLKSHCSFSCHFTINSSLWNGSDGCIDLLLPHYGLVL